MFNFDVFTNENSVKHKIKWPYIPQNHPYRMNNWRFWIRKKNGLLNLIIEQDSDVLTDKIYLYAKDLNEPKYQLLIKKRKCKAGMYLHKPNPKTFIECSRIMNDVYNNVND